MTFERPDLLLLGPVALLLVGAVLWQWRRSRRLADFLGGPVGASRLTGRRLDRMPTARIAALVLASAAVILTAAGVARDTAPPPPPRPLDLLIVVDLSRSMGADDVAPTRAGRARAVVRRLLAEGLADRASLTLFAAWPYSLVPLTDDLAVVDFFAPWVSPDMIDLRNQGTSLDAALGLAARSWTDRPRDDAIPVLLLVTDAEAHGGSAAALDSVEAVVDAGIRVWTAGVGTTSEPVLRLSGSTSAPALDANGQPVTAGYDPELLARIADAGGGGFRDVSGDAGLDDLVDDLRTLRGAAPPPEESPLDSGRILVGLALILLLLDALLDRPRRGVREEAVA